MAATRAKLLLIVSLGVVLRLSLRFSSYYGEISNRVEISSPVNAWERVVEAVTLLRWKVSPYSGDTFHESPLFLAFYRLLIGSLSDLQIALFFIAVDVLTAFVLAKVCSAQLNCTVAVERGIEEEEDSSATRLSIAGSVLLFALFYGLLMAASYWLEGGSFQFLQSNYVFMWSVGDLTPNIGLFWYFFTEMFDHFRDFFLCVFQINYFIYIIPLTFNFWRNPYLISMISLIIHSLFKPYPTVSDFALYLALLPMWSHIFESMKSTLVISATIVTTSVLAPILWYLWIVLGTANANFYFGITIGYNVAQIFLTTDLMFAYVKREFHLRNLLLYKLCKQTGKVPKIELSF
ncbi:hypothetical protein TYRP_012841 [Tyrophagus putrescentiae]|nr:hypothetical protein TYRP_012841 [Tyrophagus putrescentiae]